MKIKIDQVKVDENLKPYIICPKCGWKVLTHDRKCVCGESIEIEGIRDRERD